MIISVKFVTKYARDTLIDISMFLTKNKIITWKIRLIFIGKFFSSPKYLTYIFWYPVYFNKCNRYGIDDDWNHLRERDNGRNVNGKFVYISCLENSISDLIILDFNENRGWASRFNERIYSRKLTAGIITAPFSSWIFDSLIRNTVSWKSELVSAPVPRNGREPKVESCVSPVTLM